MDCSTCKESKETYIPKSVMETVMARQSRTILFQWITIVILIIAFACYAWYQSTWTTEEVYQEVTQEADGNSDIRFVGGDYYGWETDGQDENEEAGS